jgi:hypothetical protein
MHWHDGSGPKLDGTLAFLCMMQRRQP